MGTERLPEIEVISEHTDHPASEGAGGLAALMVVVGLVIAGTVLAAVVLRGGDRSDPDDVAVDVPCASGCFAEPDEHPAMWVQVGNVEQFGRFALALDFDPGTYRLELVDNSEIRQPVIWEFTVD